MVAVHLAIYTGVAVSQTGIRQKVRSACVMTLASAINVVVTEWRADLPGHCCVCDDARMERTELTSVRLPEKMSTDRADLDGVFASCVVGHIAFVQNGKPAVMPTAVVRYRDGIVVHGSTGSRWMRALAGGVPVAVSVTALDGVVVARSAFESSMLYRSAIVYGAFSTLAGIDKREAMDVVTERLIPGRTGEVRASSPKEFAATQVLFLPIEKWAVRISDGWPKDEVDDIASNVWAGVIRYTDRTGGIEPAPDLRSGPVVPDSVHAAAARGHSA